MRRLTDRLLSSLLVVLTITTIRVPAARADLIHTLQEATSQVESGGTTQVRDYVAAHDGFASSQAIWPSGIGIPQARTAARSRATEIAANARVFSDTFDRQEIDIAFSQAMYGIELIPAVFVRSATLEFYLPPSYLEIVNNGEIYFNEMNAGFLADLRICQTAVCDSDDSQFYFQADMYGTFREVQYGTILRGNPQLDLSALENPKVTDTTSGLLRTYRVEFPDFTGVLDLGFLDAGQPLTFEYTLQARAWGIASLNSAIAAINDPFEVDTDPVRQGAPLTLRITDDPKAVPEPSALALMVSGAVVFVLRRNRKERRTCAELRVH